MDFLAALPLALIELSRPSVLGMLFAGSMVGMAFGIVPGLQTITALSIFLPLSFWWDPMLAMYFFAGIIGSAGNGGSITAILLNMPGTAQNAATVLEGYPMTQAGRAVYALNLSASASALGAVFGVIVLVALLPVFLPILLSFGPAETFWIGVLGLASLVVAISRDLLKGLIAVGIGMVLATVGLGGPRLPAPRFVFGSSYLIDGLNVVVIIIGLLVVSEVLATIASAGAPRAGAAASFPALSPAERSRQRRDGLLAPFRYPGNFLRSALLGMFVGAVPGVGGSVAQFLSYNAAYAASKTPEEFGKGSSEGLMASEAAINAKEGGSLFPTFLFGIPGTAEMAIVLGAWQIYGLRPGPYFLATNADLAWALILGLLLANLLNSAMTVLASPALSRVPAIDVRYVAPVVLVATVIAVYALRQNVLDVAAALAFGLFGLLQKRFGYPVIGTVVGFVVGSVVERNYYLALQSSIGDFGVFLNSGISVVLALASVSVVLFGLLRTYRRRRPA